jgi:hypothetical protein
VRGRVSKRRVYGCNGSWGKTQAGVSFSDDVEKTLMSRHAQVPKVQ